ncbi:MAG TPA: hypothetical protein VFM18_04885 [Methanosarcina sp.]|nr:hypothetical protein [Methanosarcina sp.]
MSGYLRFKGTNNELVDNLLFVLECAGSAYHHTEYWDEIDELSGLGKSYVQQIQDAAQEIADYIKEKEVQ